MATYNGHPLFLQMILEEASEGQIVKRTRAELIQDWVERRRQPQSA
jgi:hypothetical protein